MNPVYITVPARESLPPASLAHRDQLCVVRASPTAQTNLYLCRSTGTGGAYEWVLLSMVAGANPDLERGGTSIIVSGAGNPENNIEGSGGDLYLRTDGTSRRASLYAKSDENDGTEFGWIPLDGYNRDLWECGIHKDPGGTTYSSVGMAAPVSLSAVTSANTTLGPVGNWVTGAVTGNNAGYVGPALVRPEWTIDCTFLVVPPTSGDLTDVRVHVGLFDGNPVGSDTNSSLNYAEFLMSHPSINGNWQTRTCNGTSSSVFDTGIAYVVGTFLLRIVMTDAYVDFYIDGVHVRHQTTNLPIGSGALLLSPRVHVETRTNAAKNLRFGYFKALTR
jgi:hypothetical protein